MTIPVTFKRGTTRLVVILKKIVIKIPLSLYGFRCNRQEWENYKSHNTGRYAKTQFSFPFGLFNIMERADMPRNFKHKIKERYYHSVIKDKVYIYSVDDYIGNYGFVGRKLVLIDYA